MSRAHVSKPRAAEQPAERPSLGPRPTLAPTHPRTSASSAFGALHDTIEAASSSDMIVFENGDRLGLVATLAEAQEALADINRYAASPMLAVCCVICSVGGKFKYCWFFVCCLHLHGNTCTNSSSDACFCKLR